MFSDKQINAPSLHFSVMSKPLSSLTKTPAFAQAGGGGAARPPPSSGAGGCLEDLSCGCFGDSPPPPRRGSKKKTPMKAPPRQKAGSNSVGTESGVVKMLRAVSSAFLFKNPAAERDEAIAAAPVNPAAAALAAAKAQKS